MISLNEIVITIFIVIFLEEDTGNASALVFHMLHKTLPNGLGTDGSVTSDRTCFPVIEESNLSVRFERQGQRAVLTASDISTYLHLPGIVGIEGKDHAAHTQLRAFEMLDIQEQVTRQFKEM